jgi:hypothetical protein
MKKVDGWQRAFENQIQLPNGRTLVTLHDAATYITNLPKKESAVPEWQARAGFEAVHLNRARIEQRHWRSHFPFVVLGGLHDGRFPYRLCAMTAP